MNELHARMYRFCVKPLWNYWDAVQEGFTSMEPWEEEGMPRPSCKRALLMAGCLRSIVTSTP